ncbi:hypothetical protein Z948_2244 [Sulfitobacter donghicola DSW-25 = KCTC 12864 = JCM 14565]|nr:hypothetical protein Z948_2244 [Sulfitobacter donghicola DSW-25 = KCTC 12864 = JCM 14565]
MPFPSIGALARANVASSVLVSRHMPVYSVRDEQNATYPFAQVCAGADNLGAAQRSLCS